MRRRWGVGRAHHSHKTQQEVVASPYKIEKYYQEHLDDYKIGDQIKLRMIFIKKSPPELLAVARDAAAPASEPAKAPAETDVVSEAVAVTPETNQAVQASAIDTQQTAQAASTGQVVSTIQSNAAPPPAPPALVDPRRRLGEEILAKLDAGDSFDSMAKLYSEGKEAKEGGDWGWIGHDVLRKELNDVAFSLKPGQHSKLIETDEGYYIVQVDDVKSAHTRPLAEVRDEIEKILLEQQRTKMQEQWVKELRAKAFIRLF